MSARRKPIAADERFFTVEEYLEFENASPYKHEYFNGYIFPLGCETPLSRLPDDPSDPEQYPALYEELGVPQAMAGASSTHNQIVFNIAGSLHAQLRGSACRGFSSDMRVRVGNDRQYTYPDVVLACGEIELGEEEFDVLLNPSVIVEVLSPSTESYDRGDKRAQFARIASLHDYILVAQDSLHVQHHVRQEDGSWLARTYEGEEASFDLVGAPATLALGDIYERVTLPEPSRRSPRLVRRGPNQTLEEQDQS